ncbi:MAG: MaoC family dehydratase N-terminal domain-containing protein, partial [Dehalococcoidia bacterium]|nr:MaoC family dehydratase N-terminal domain-containing protein [Dehalococcoidia bacterium]
MANIDTENTIGMSEGFITDEALEKWKERIGLKLRIPNLFNRLACRDAIRKYVDGIGDVNPLFRDEEYAKSTRYSGGI